jgi:hypothetical protein
MEPANAAVTISRSCFRRTRSTSSGKTSGIKNQYTRKTETHRQCHAGYQPGLVVRHSAMAGTVEPCIALDAIPEYQCSRGCREQRDVRSCFNRIGPSGVQNNAATPATQHPSVRLSSSPKA